MALDLPLPRCIYAHSFWIREGQKMSKSLGNFIDLPTIQKYVDAYGLDAWRYYMATQGPLGATDADFSDKHFHDIYTTDLVNTVGNCASRVAAMIGKYFDGTLPAETDGGSPRRIADHDWPAICQRTVAESRAAMDKLDLSGSIGAAVGLVRKIDAFINLTEPYKLAKDESRRDELGAILYQCCEALRIASLLLWAVMPERMEQLWTSMNQSIDPRAGKLQALTSWGGLQSGASIQKLALFPRMEKPSV